MTLHPIPGFTETARLSGVAPFPLMAELGIGAVADEQSPLMKWELLRQYHRERGILTEPKTEEEFVSSLRAMGSEQLTAFAESLRKADETGVLSEIGKRQLVLTEQEIAYRAGEGAAPEPARTVYLPPVEIGPEPESKVEPRPRSDSGGIILLGALVGVVAVAAFLGRR